MLAEAEDMNKAEDEAEAATGSKKSKKAKLSSKSKRRKRMKAKDEDGYETDHQVRDKAMFHNDVWRHMNIFSQFCQNIKIFHIWYISDDASICKTMVEISVLKIFLIILWVLKFLIYSIFHR